MSIHIYHHQPGFFPTSKDIPQGAIGRGVLPAVRLALQHVNESPLFTKYRLDLVWNNTKVMEYHHQQQQQNHRDQNVNYTMYFLHYCPFLYLNR
ncbi:hypothetical protein DERP_009948 [Dermatophagoides pteronyssinus]|uniref:Uncharacterized protein n=1 Tax=Dermatophagoides pteronyssinus TaxID=6956 RepID=A0ABQ8J1Y7_DERPT|nr:hypothetical protein DERP_009948 [Dermatophagoides pteronyssinus]